MHESEKWKWSRLVVSDLHDPMDCSLPGSFIHGIFQARVLEGVAIAFFGAQCELASSLSLLWDKFPPISNTCTSENAYSNWKSLFLEQLVWYELKEVDMDF